MHAQMEQRRILTTSESYLKRGAHHFHSPCVSSTYLGYVPGKSYKKTVKSACLGKGCVRYQVKVTYISINFVIISIGASLRACMHAQKLKSKHREY